MKRTFQRKTVNTVFKVRNIASDHRTIRIFTYPILWNYIIDLLDIPEVSESDIRHSLLKGELKAQADKGFIEVTECTIDLTQFDSEQRSFLQSLGISSGIASAPDVVANISELSALDESLFSDGIAIPVRTLFDWFTLVKTSTETADGITIVETLSGVGRWQRACIPNDQWRRQLTWYMDSVNGDDENVGSEAAPIKTFSEFRRRHGRLLVVPGVSDPVTFTILDVGEVEQDFLVDFWGESATKLDIIGTQTVLYSGSITGYVAWNAATQQEPEVTDSAIPVSWTDSGLVYQQMVLTSGTNEGARGYIDRDLGSKTALIPPLILPNTYSCEPSVTDTYDIVKQTIIKGDVTLAGGGWSEIIHCQIDGSITQYDGIRYLTHCAVGGYSINLNDGTLWLLGGTVYNEYGVVADSGTLVICGCLMATREVSVRAGGAVVLYEKGIFDGCEFDIQPNGYVRFTQWAPQAFINFGASASPFLLKINTLLDVDAVLWGTSGNTPAYAFKLGNMAILAADIENLKIMGSTTNDILLGSIGVDYDETRPMEDGYSGAKVFDRYSP